MKNIADWLLENVVQLTMAATVTGIVAVIAYTYPYTL